ncbi:nucleotide-diphosphate-sugar epimerase [Spirilliplanes yamanashiensis]|uniref:Nucleotide-diphosphate-sugar epimerase n=1 Tax=Spirilliplanes yamanashiensis TaxID=42233 RepID=A0A8J3Y6A0_9ACTN|nr:nucleotide-diphosphate-sugar epimerase [Spirilliplanes yamanashiensis]
MTGASGTLGRMVVPALTAAGHEVRPMSSRPRAGWAHADLATGDGLAAAVAGAHTIVHLASVPGGGRRTALVDVEGTRRLLDAASAAGVRHVVYVSIVGVDRVPLAYYRAKLATERVVAGGGVPWSVLRATQFHEFVDQLLRMSTRLGPLVLDRRMRAQPVATADVAARLAGMVGAGASGAVEEFGGPETMALGDVAPRWQRARRTPRPELPIRLPGGFGRAVRDGGLCTTATPTGTGTFDEYLAGAYGLSRS